MLPLCILVPEAYFVRRVTTTVLGFQQRGVLPVIAPSLDLELEKNHS